MKMMKKINFLLLFIAMLLWGGCKAPSLLPVEKVELPETFSGDFDTVSIASISRSDFFPDVYLQQYIDTALVRNHSFQKAIELVSIARGQVGVSKGALLPELTLGLGGGVERFGDYTMDGVGNSTTNTPELSSDKHIPDPYTNINIGLNFNWEADVWGKLTDKKRAAVARWMKTIEAKRLAQTLLVAEVATQYYDLVGLDKKRFILKEAIRKARDSYQLTNELMKEGEVSRLSVDQFRSRRLKLEEMLLDTEQRIGEVERALALLVGKLPFEILRSDFEEVCKMEFPSQTGIPAQWIHYRPDIKAAELELLASKSDVLAARKAFFPSLLIGGGAGFNAFNLKQWFNSPASLVYNLAAGITAPIFRKNEIRVLWSEAKSRQRIALLDYHQVVLQSYQEVVNLLAASWQIDKRRILKEEESRIHHRSIYNANELFETGFAGYLDVLSADERYLECELERVELIITYCKVHAFLYRSLGGGCY